jgi:hypothetical protein
MYDSGESPVPSHRDEGQRGDDQIPEFTFVISVVAVSISLSSADRSVKPGKTCLHEVVLIMRLWEEGQTWNAASEKVVPYF